MSNDRAAEDLRQIMNGIAEAFTGLGDVFRAQELHEKLLRAYISAHGGDGQAVSVRRYGPAKMEFRYGQQMMAVEISTLLKWGRENGLIEKEQTTTRPSIEL